MWDSLPNGDVVFLSQARGEYASVSGTYTQTALDVAADLRAEGFVVAYEYPPEGAATQLRAGGALIVEIAISVGSGVAANAVWAGIRKVISHRWGLDTKVRIKWTRWKVGSIERESIIFSGTAEQLGELLDSERDS
jgi:hypothetical protein